MTDAPTLAQLRDFAAARTLWRVSGVQTALDRLGFLQADPIRAPARAQDLILMQRVKGYRAGDLEQQYAALQVEEDYVPNYGFVTPAVHALLHPRMQQEYRIERDAPGLTGRVLEHVQQHGDVHPRQLEQVLGKLSARNGWGGMSSATTRALEALHHRGELRVTRRDRGVKVYGPAILRPHALTRAEQATGIVQLLARLYAPLPRQSLTFLYGLSGYGAPGLKAELKRAHRELEEGWLASAKVEGLTYQWPADEEAAQTAPPGVRLLAPFDPLVWDRRRFEHLHGWAYRFEAYTKPEKRTMGYYALPLLHAGKAVGWGNLKVDGGELVSDIGLLPGIRRTAAFERSLKVELERYRAFLGLEGAGR